MRHYFKVLLTAGIAALAFSFVVSTASARNLSVDDRDFEIIWEDLAFAPAAGSEVVCSVTLLGSFHRQTIAKVARSLIGAIHHVRLMACDGGTATALTATLPWHVTYESFRGTLPRITEFTVLLINAAFAVRNDLEVSCLARTTSGEPAAGIANLNASGQIISLQADPSRLIDTNDVDGTLCDLFGVDGSFEGTARVTDLRGNLVFVTLI